MNQDPLAQLRDIHLPEPIGWWSPAPGWWIIACLLIGLLVWAGYSLFHHYRKRRHRKVALKELAELKQHSDSRYILEQIAVLLRRVAMQSFGRKMVANLSGQKWVEFLDQTGETSQFSNGPGEALGDNLYHADCEISVDPLLQVVERWIRGHKQC